MSSVLPLLKCTLTYANRIWQHGSSVNKSKYYSTFISMYLGIRKPHVATYFECENLFYLMESIVNGA